MIRAFLCGAANEIRTRDLVLTKDVLYLLSHSSILINIFASTIFNNTKALKAASFSFYRSKSHRTAPQ